MAKKKPGNYTNAGPDGPFGYGSKPKDKPGFGKNGNVDRSDADRDETESVPRLGARDKKPFQEKK